MGRSGLSSFATFVFADAAEPGTVSERECLAELFFIYVVFSARPLLNANTLTSHPFLLAGIYFRILCFTWPTSGAPRLSRHKCSHRGRERKK